MYRQTSFPSAIIRFIDKLTVFSEPTVPSARLLGLGFTLYPSNKQRYSTRFIPSLCRASERKARLAGWIEGCACAWVGLCYVQLQRENVSRDESGPSFLQKFVKVNSL